MFTALKTWILGFLPPGPALRRMRLGPEGNPNNPLMLQFFTWDTTHKDMSWWKHLECEIPRLAELGFTQIWLPPPNKGENQLGRGYDAYDLWDLGEFDQKGTVKTRWGTRDELLRACQVATTHGVDILIDAVLNHKLGADRVEAFRAVPVNPENRLVDEGPVRDIDGWTAFDFKGRGNKVCDSFCRFAIFSFSAGLDWDHRTRTKAIYCIASEGRKGWSQHVSKELGNYDYLLGVDIDHRHPDVQKDLLDWGVWILETTGAAGFRLDAIKHMDRRFLHRFITHVRSQSKKPRMFSVSEYWSGDLKSIMPYIQAFRGETAFFDVPLHMNFHHASKHPSEYDLRSILNNTIVKEKPRDAVTFVIGQSLESWVDGNFKIQAYSLILLRPDGHPCVFYGDLYPNEECYNAEVSRNLTLLIEARKQFAYGPCHDYFQDAKCIGFVRMGDSGHPGCAVILSNKEASAGDFTHTIRMFVGREHAGSVFRSFMSENDRTEIDSKGWGQFTCPANQVQLWIRS
ncbi:glycoside hydrolase family 13 protein [Mycena metata]|uniref:Glycoside hydrolase family 13 protein n=1 Tax=Mycena metata TaxID=1033252 RepID=A0AAD7JYQ8_9AGAR|nr:glycoside hydrolase family 13 protein [Mycena metata]